MDVPGVGLRDQVVTFDITGPEAAAANAMQRRRLAATLQTLDDGQWAAPSRCSDWSVQDVVVHLTQMGGVVRSAIETARAGERFELFRDFDPRTTPARLVREAPSQSPAETLEMHERGTDDLIDVVGASADGDYLVATPAGRQPIPRAVLHALFDSAVHERDILAPLGVSAADGPGEAELTAITAYQVLVTLRMASMFGRATSVELRLDGAAPLTAVCDGADVGVNRCEGTGAPIATGDAIEVLDAIAGRRNLADALAAPVDVIAALSCLAPLL